LGELAHWNLFQGLAAWLFGTFLVLFGGTLFTFGPGIGIVHAATNSREQWAAARSKRGPWVFFLLLGVVTCGLSLIPFAIYSAAIARKLPSPLKPVVASFLLRALVAAAVWALPTMMWLPREPVYFTSILFRISIFVAVVAGLSTFIRLKDVPRATQIVALFVSVAIAFLLGAQNYGVARQSCIEESDPLPRWCSGADMRNAAQLIPVYVTAGAVTAALLLAPSRRPSRNEGRLSSGP
jgi:hypothetical protein